MKSGKMERERTGRRVKAGSLSGLTGSGTSGSGTVNSGTVGSGVRRQRSLEWSGAAGDRYSSSDDDPPPQHHPPLADRLFASLLAQATQQFDNEQRRRYGSESVEEPSRYTTSPQRQASPFPLESLGRRYYRRNRNSKGEEIFNGETGGVAGGGGTLVRRGRRTEDYTHENSSRNTRALINNASTNSGAASERECDSPPEPAPPEVPPRGPSLHVTLRHRNNLTLEPAPPGDADRLYLPEDYVMTEGHMANGNGNYPARSPMSSSTTGHSSSSHHR